MTRPRRPFAGKLLDPAWRQERARRAGAGARAAYERQRLTRGEHFESKGAAYAAGYRRGYQTAMVWWRRRARRVGGVA